MCPHFPRVHSQLPPSRPRVACAHCFTRRSPLKRAHNRLAPRGKESRLPLSTRQGQRATGLRSHFPPFFYLASFQYRTSSSRGAIPSGRVPDDHQSAIPSPYLSSFLSHSNSPRRPTTYRTMASAASTARLVGFVTSAKNSLRRLGRARERTKRRFVHRSTDIFGTLLRD